MEFDFSNYTQQILDSAGAIASEENCSSITAYHLLFVLIRIFQDRVPPGKMSTWNYALKHATGKFGKTSKPSGTIEYDKLLKKAFERADHVRTEKRDKLIHPEHLLDVLIGPNNPLIDMERLLEDIEEKDDSKAGSEIDEKLPEGSILSKICVNFSQKAKLGVLEPVIGREYEIRQVIRILLKRKKNNPLLLGEAGVGKTAIIEGIAQRLAESRDNPLFRSLKNRDILGLDIVSLIGGTSLRGELEKRLNELVGELEKNSHKYILFIDEVHNLMGAGKSEGSADMANYLKPALARGEICIIGATTLAEYKRFIEPDSAFKRRLDTVIIREPSLEETTGILKKVQPLNETFHKVIYETDVVERIAEWATNYFSETRRPDSALNLMDNIGAFAAQLSDLSGDPVAISPETGAEFIQQAKQIDKESVLQEANQRIVNLKKSLESHFRGDEQALNEIFKILSPYAISGYPKNKITPLLFLNVAGMGRIESIRMLAEYLYPAPEKIFEADLAAYTDRESLYSLIGPPRGIEGFQDGGELTEFVKQNPQCCLLLNNVDHCHPNVLRILMEPLRKGIITDNARISYPFYQSMMIFTAGSDESLHSMYGKEIKNLLPHKIAFCEPSSTMKSMMVRESLQSVTNYFSRMGYELAMEADTEKWIVQTVLDANSWETTEDRVKKLIEEPLAVHILQKSVSPGTVLISVENDELCFQFTGKPAS